MLLWEGHHRPPMPIPYSVRNVFIYAETVILAFTGRPANAKLYQCLRIYPVPKHSPSRWMVYLFVIFMYSVPVTLPSNYRDHVFVSPFPRHLCVLLHWTNAICPWVRLNCLIISQHSPIHGLHMIVNIEKRWDFPNYCSQTITVCVCSCAHKACSYHHPRHQQVAVRERGRKIMAPRWNVWIIARTGW